jgi:hypothetical protein
MNLFQDQKNSRELEQKIENYELLHNSGLQQFPANGVNPDGSCTCPEGFNCKHIGKHPKSAGWQKHKFENTDQIRQFCQSNPYNNLAVNCNGLVVIDVDQKGIENFNTHILPLLADIKTLVIDTPSGGFHGYFTSNKVFKNSVALFEGIDIRTKGGLAIAAGSRHKNGGIYKIRYSGTDKTDEIHIEDLPTNIEKLILHAQQKTKVSQAGIDINQNLGKLIPEGQRNSASFKEVCRLLQQGMSIDEIRPKLYDFNQKQCVPPLEDSELETILRSASKYEQGFSYEWGEPDLKYSLKEEPLADIDENLIPDFFKDFVVKNSLALGVPKNSVLVTILTLFSTLFGCYYKVKPKQKMDYAVTLNLWGLIVAPPSSKKTAILSVLEKSVKIIEKYYIDKRKQLADDRDHKLAALKADKKQLGGKDDENKLSAIEQEITNLKSQQIPYWMFSTSEATPEALIQSFKDNYRGILLFRDELRGLFDSLNKTGYETLRSLLTEAWNGNKAFSLSRIGRGIIDAPSMTLSVLGGSQPDVLLEMFPSELMRGMGSDGMLARFQLFSMFNSSQIKEFNSEIDFSNEKLKLNQLLMSAHDFTKEYNTTGLPFIFEVYLSAEGFAEYNKYCKYIHAVIINEDIVNQAYRSHIGKFDRLVLSLAGQFHLLAALEKGQVPQSEIEARWVKYAISITKYMDLQIQKLYFSVGKTLSADSLISRIKKGQIFDGMSLRNICRNGWKNLKEKEDLLAAIERVSDSNWITVIVDKPRGGGRPTEIIKLNPKLIEHLNRSNKENI